MVRVVVTCPDRRGAFPGFYTEGRFWPVGATEVELEDAEVEVLLGQIERGESLLQIEFPAPSADAPEPAPKKKR